MSIKCHYLYSSIVLLGPCHKYTYRGPFKETAGWRAELAEETDDVTSVLVVFPIVWPWATNSILTSASQSLYLQNGRRGLGLNKGALKTLIVVMS